MKNHVKSLTSLILLVVCAIAATGQTTEFAFQGKLNDGATPANANYDFEFRLFSVETGGAAIGTLQRLGVSVSNGIFAAKLDFGGQFDGNARWLEIAVKPAGSGSGYQQLLPRQAITSTPYSLRSLNAATAANSLQLGGVNASQYILTTDARLSDERNPLPDSANYIQNTSSPQFTSNFNVSGNGTLGGLLSANRINTATEYNLGGNRVLSVSGGGANLFVGPQAGNPASTGSNNAFVGSGAGNANTTGSGNSFFGNSAGLVNTTGGQNTFVGTFAGISNTTASSNAFFGTNAGSLNNAGNNAFFGANAGAANTAGSNNSFVGESAGQANTTGNFNSFVGASAGKFNMTGAGNSFVGARAGFLNTTGSDNSFVGAEAGSDNTTGLGNSFVGWAAGSSNTTGNDNSFVGKGAGVINTTGFGNSFVGIFAGRSNTTGSNNTVIGANADVGSNNLSFATAIGAGATVGTSNTIVLGRSSDDVRVPGNLVVVTLGAAGVTDVCRNASLQLSTCSSSLRYKSGVQTFTGGLEIVSRLRPIVFNWNQGARDVGFGAEEVQKVEPLLATYNDKGEIEGVKYKQITTVLVNAVQQQQTQIELLRRQMEMQNEQIRVLTLLFCRSNKKADICMEQAK